MSLVVITGLAMEARIASSAGAAILVGAGQPDRLAAQLDAAIAQGARRLVSFGVAGALAPYLRPGDLVVARCVRDGPQELICDVSWRAAMTRRIRLSSSPARTAGFPEVSAEESERSSFSGLFRFSRREGWAAIAAAGAHAASADILGVAAPVADATGKSELFAETGAAAVDMESAIVARAARRHDVPFAIVRVIADPADKGLPGAALVAMRANGGVDIGAVFRALLFEPRQISALAHLGLASYQAFSTLARVHSLLGPDFSSADAM
jgi:nucleoside phosphorylase